MAFYLRGRSLQQMSREFETPVGTIKRRLHVARKRLRQQLERPAQARERKRNPELVAVGRFVEPMLTMWPGLSVSEAPAIFQLAAVHEKLLLTLTNEHG